MDIREIDHRQRINEYMKELVALSIQRDDIERKMGKRHLAIRGLLNLLDNKAERELYKGLLESFRVHMGITDLIWQCLYLSDIPKTPTEIRDFIVNYGGEASTQQNLLQAVHTLLKRLKAKGTVKKVTNADGEVAYRLFNLEEMMKKSGVQKNEVDELAKAIMAFQPKRIEK